MPADPSPTPPPLGRALAVYTALRFGLMGALSLLGRLFGLPWLMAVTVGVLLAAILSLLVLRAPMRRLSAAIAGSRGRPARPAVGEGPAGASGAAGAPDAGDPYAYDPYADDEGDAADADDRGTGRPGQESSSSATPTSRP